MPLTTYPIEGKTKTADDKLINEDDVYLKNISKSSEQLKEDDKEIEKIIEEYDKHKE